MDSIAALLRIFNAKCLHIGVVGVGAVGGVFAAALLAGIHGDRRVKVSFLVTDRHLGPLRAGGLLLVTPTGQEVYYPDKVAISPHQLEEPVNIALLAVKGDRLEQALRYWRQAIAMNAWVVSLMNGVNNGMVLAGHLPGRRIMDGCVYVGAHLIAPGRVCWEGGVRRLICGDISGDSRGLDHLCELFRRGGVDASAFHPVAEVVWKKFLFVSPVAVVTSLFSCSLRGILENNERLNLFRILTRELMLLAHKAGHLLTEQDIEPFVDKLTCFDEVTTSSLYRDLSQGRRGEFDVLVEEIVTLAQKFGLDLPHYSQCRKKLLGQYNCKIVS